MIGLIFDFASETIEVRVEKKTVYFRTKVTGSQFAIIDHLKLNYSGVCKENPDLKDKKDWREQAINRFKEKIKKMKNETEVSEYIISDLTKYGYKPLYRQKQGFRPEKL